MIQELFKSEAEDWEKIQDLRRLTNLWIELQHVQHAKLKTRDAAMRRAIKVIKATLAASKLSQRLHGICPGHGVGHIVRDYAHMLQLSNIEIDPQNLFIGLVAGVLHDIGCAFVHRYDDGKRAVRHAEAGALFLLYLYQEHPEIDLNDSERKLIAYAVAAHTHYLGTAEVVCEDGVTRTIEPYQDMLVAYKGAPVGDNPCMAVWLPRWIDRLDCNGPGFAARHYLTTSYEHFDFSSGMGFVSMGTFSETMRPIIRTAEEIKAAGNLTMLEHLDRFMRSQTNESPYGKWDSGYMVFLRDAQSARLKKIIDAVLSESPVSYPEGKEILRDWSIFLKTNIEPSPAGIQAADKLEEMFAGLSGETQEHWLNGFKEIMRRYENWTSGVCITMQEMEEANPAYDTKSGSAGLESIFYLPEVSNDVRKVLYIPDELFV